MSRRPSDDTFLPVLARARSMFSLLLILVTALSGASWVAGYRSGEFDRMIVTPIKNTLSGIAASFAEEEPQVSTPSGSWKKYLVTPTPIPARKPTTVTRTNPPVNPTRGTNAYDEAVRKMNEDAAAARAAQDAWWQQQQKQFEATKLQNQQNFNSFNQQAQQDMEQFRQESQARIDAFKEANGF